MGDRKVTEAPMIQLPPRKPHKVTETDIVKRTIEALNHIAGVRAIRNSNIVMTDARGIPVKAGLGNGSPDIVGIITVGGDFTAFPIPCVYASRLPPFAAAFGAEMKTPQAYAKKNHGVSDDQEAWGGASLHRGMPVFVGESADMIVDKVLFMIRELRSRFGSGL